MENTEKEKKEQTESSAVRAVFSVFLRKIAAVLPESGRGKPCWRRLPMGPLTADNLRQPLVVSSRVSQAPAPLWLGEGQPLGDKNPR